MAAILCSACNDICGNLGDVCGKGCSGLCSGCGQACSGVCDCFADACHGIAAYCATPFSIFVVTAVVFNLPSAYMGLPEVLDLGCRGSQWLFVHGALSAINIAAALYMAKKVTARDPPDLEQQGGPRRPSTVFGRAGHLLCYDPVMAVYILVLCGFFCWLWTGGIWSLSGKAANGCSESQVGSIAACLSFGWAFIFCGIGALGLGMCCAYCGVGENNNNDNTTLYYGSTGTTQPPQTQYVNVEDAGKKGKMGTPQTTTPVAVAPAVPASNSGGGGKQQAEIPTVTATLF